MKILLFDLMKISQDIVWFLVVATMPVVPVLEWMNFAEFDEFCRDAAAGATAAVT